MATRGDSVLRRGENHTSAHFWFREKWVLGSLLEVIDRDERHSGVGRPHVILCACCSNQERSISYEKSSRRDHLTSTTKDGKIELTEEQLSRVGGGVHLKYQAALKVRTETVYQ